MTERLCAIKGGYDWFDASVDFVVLTSHVSLSELESRYRGRTSDKRISFVDWLVREGHARLATENDIEVYET